MQKDDAALVLEMYQASAEFYHRVSEDICTRLGKAGSRDPSHRLAAEDPQFADVRRAQVRLSGALWRIARANDGRGIPEIHGWKRDAPSQAGQRASFGNRLRSARGLLCGSED